MSISHSQKQFVIRALRADDDMDRITALLHRAYAPLAQRGWHFVASHQDRAVTVARCQKGESFVVQMNEDIIGTITLASIANTSGSPWLDRDDVASFGQFAVEPSLQRFGIGNELMEAVEARAKTLHIKELALDTCEHAEQLIAYYSKRGFRFIEYVKWPVVNYRSVVMSKNLQGHS